MLYDPAKFKWFDTFTPQWTHTGSYTKRSDSGCTTQYRVGYIAMTPKFKRLNNECLLSNHTTSQVQQLSSSEMLRNPGWWRPHPVVSMMTTQWKRPLVWNCPLHPPAWKWQPSLPLSLPGWNHSARWEAESSLSMCPEEGEPNIVN